MDVHPARPPGFEEEARLVEARAARRVSHPRASRPAPSAVSRALKEVRWSLPARG